MANQAFNLENLDGDEGRQQLCRGAGPRTFSALSSE
jgi:hypothetical protein